MSDWIIGVIEATGYLGIALLMLLENVFPPIPSELVLPFAGYVAASGELHPVGVLVAAVAGSLLGPCPGTGRAASWGTAACSTSRSGTAACSRCRRRTSTTRRTGSSGTARRRLRSAAWCRRCAA